MITDNYDDDEYSGQAQGSSAASKVFIVLLLLFYAYLYLFFRDVEITVSMAVTYGIVGTLLLALGFLQETVWKHKTPKFVCHGDFTTWDGYYEICGDYAVIKRGGVDAMGLKFSGGRGNGCIVVPEISVTTLGRSGASTAWVFPVPFEALPRDVQGYVKQQNIQEPYMMGWASPTQYRRTLNQLEQDAKPITIESYGKVETLSNPSIMRIVHEMMELNKESSRIRSMLNAKFGDYGNVISEVMGWKDRTRAQKFFDTFRDQENKKQE